MILSTTHKFLMVPIVEIHHPDGVPGASNIFAVNAANTLLNEE